MLVIASYPRSGNHLVRFMVEYLSGRPTLGCASNLADKPIHTNIFHDAPDILAHVTGEPIAHKAHFVREVDRIALDRIILIRRDPVEAILAHAKRPKHDFFFLYKFYRFYRRIIKGAQLYFELVRYFDRFDGPKVALSYERLISRDAAEYLPEIDKVAMMLGPLVDPARLTTMRNDFDRLRGINTRVSNRSWSGYRSDGLTFYYRDRAGWWTLGVVRRAVAFASSTKA